MILSNGNFFLAILPVLFLVLTFIFFLQDFEWRVAFLLSAISLGTTAVLLTESLSLFKQITFATVTFSWLFLDILAGLILFKKAAKTGFKRIHSPFINLQFFDYAGLALILIIILTTGFIAYVSPPDSYDSMTYHMSRVMHWIQNQSVAAYPTNIDRQILMTPGSEYAILQFQLLTGSDRLANMIEWFSFTGAILGVSLIAKELGADRKGQIISSVICSMIPLAILEASSTQTDLTCAFWLVCFVYFGFDAIKNQNWRGPIVTGLSLGLATFSKSTIYFFAFPFVLLIAFGILNPKNKPRIWLWSICVLIVIAINGAQFFRSYALTKNPLGPSTQEEQSMYTNQIIALRPIVSNIVRNIYLHIAMPSQPVNNLSYIFILNIHKMLGVSENDPRTTFPGVELKVNTFSTDENFAGNPIDLLSIIVIFLYYIIFLKTTPKAILYYILALIGSALLFCSFIKWQPYGSRLHTPWFILSSAIIGIAISKIKPAYIANTIICIFFLTSLPVLVEGKPRPLVGNENIFTQQNLGYFATRPDLFRPYTLAVGQLDQMNVHSIGLVTEDNDFEYPLWVLLSEHYKPLPRIEHVDVTNETGRISKTPLFRTFVPEVLLVTHPPSSALTTFMIEHRTYQQCWEFKTIALYCLVK